MKLIRTQDAVGQVLCHDITRIIPGATKDAVFRKGHIVRKEDIPVLLSVGKDHLYVWENDETTLRENDAADVLRELCQGENMHATGPKEGKIELAADCDGLFLADLEQLRAVNALAEDSRVDLLEYQVVLCVPDGNPKGIDSFDALAQALKTGDILMAMGNRDVPVGQCPQKILAYYGLDEGTLAAAG